MLTQYETLNVNIEIIKKSQTEILEENLMNEIKNTIKSISSRLYQQRKEWIIKKIRTL